MKTFALAGATVLALSTAATAATMNVEEFNYDSNLMTPNSTYSTTWTSGADSWDIEGFAFTLNGLSGGNDLPLVTVSFENSGSTLTYGDWDITTQGNRSTGRMFVDGFTTTGDFTVTLDYGAGARNVFANYVFDATLSEDPGAPAPVPLPATALLLLAGVGGLAGVKKLRRKG